MYKSMNNFLLATAVPQSLHGCFMKILIYSNVFHGHVGQVDIFTLLLRRPSLFIIHSSPTCDVT